MISPAPVCDSVLLQRFAFDGDDAAFEELVRRHHAMARGVCRRVLGPAGDADDAAQSAFVSLATHARPLANRLGSTGSLAGWLYRVAVNAALQQRRATKARRRREMKVGREREGHTPRGDAQMERAELLEVLDEELKELPLRYRTPLVLCHLEGKTQHEAATQLGLSYGTLRRRLDRGRKLLRVQLSRRGIAATSTLLALLWKSTTAEAASESTRFVKDVLSATKGGSSPVAVIRPRVATAGRVPQPPPSMTSSSISGTVYKALLAVVIIAAALPPVISAMTTSTSEPAPSVGGPVNTPPAPTIESPGHSTSLAPASLQTRAT